MALMGVALGMGIDPLWAASPILCAAVIGDGVSPLSDTSNVIAGAVGTDMFESVKFQLPMTIPVAVITFIIYVIMGAMGTIQSADTSSINALVQAIGDSYNLGIHCLLPIILVFGLLILKMPAIPAILIGSLSGLVVACLFQGESFTQVINAMWSGYVLEADNQVVAELFSRGGVSSMTATCVLIIFSFGLFGILNTAKVLDVLVVPLSKMIKSRFSGVVCVVILGFLANLSSSASFSEVFTGNIMGPVYEKLGLDKRDFVRAAVVGCLVFSMYIPFVVMPATVTSSLGVDPVAMIPYYISMPIYLVVLLVITYFNLDKKLLNKKK